MLFYVFILYEKINCKKINSNIISVKIIFLLKINLMVWFSLKQNC